MKALEKDRNRRYETANGFARTSQRYLADEPVQACPPSAAYRLRKFVRRNKGPVLAAAIVFLVLVGGIIGTTRGLIIAEHAVQAESIALRASTRQGHGREATGPGRERDRPPRLRVRGSRPHGGGEGRSAAAGDPRGPAGPGGRELEGDAVGDPLVVARLQIRLGRTYLGTGPKWDPAEAILSKSAATREHPS